eukprot:649947-Pleurochrysis_carterae.AAC.1
MLPSTCIAGYTVAGDARLRALPDIAADAPPALLGAKLGPCHACAEANAPRLSHPHSKYEPSYAGRLIHADIAGPFVPTGGGHRYLLVLDDDHSRFKM